MVKKGKAQAKPLRNKDEEELKELELRCQEEFNPEWRKFSELPLSRKTQEGLKAAGFVEMTDIQRTALPRALKGLDVLGAAKTGSGKTLAFVIPVLERLYRLKWSDVFGVGAIVITPTRELAYQIFEVLRKVGRKHTFSAGLIIGGKDLATERALIVRMNILIATPGRLQQHMEETPDFSCDDLQMLVLDEADRILDLGFEKSLNAILEGMPRNRQTLLFSATQTKSVRDLARLSLKDPEYVAVHESERFSTPKNLLQTYVVSPLPGKLELLFSFLRTHTQDKVLVFVSSCKQVRFIYETFRRMRPGMPLMALYGKQKQLKRMAIYTDYCKKQAACLFATDIAARGLDFPAVNWVVQLDCPEDANTYIHRVGRTARYQSGGKALLVLLPSEEEAMLKALEAKRIPIQKIEVNPNKTHSIAKDLQAFCAQDSEINHLAQKCFTSYVRSVYLQADKAIFDVHALPLKEFALSLGLAKAPKVRFVQKAKKQFGAATEGKQQKAAAKKEEKDEEEVEKKKGKKPVQVATSDGEEEGDLLTAGGDDESDNELFEKRPAPELEPLNAGEIERMKKSKTKVELAKKLVRKGIVQATKVVFDDDGQPVNQQLEDEEEEDVESGSEGGIDVEKVRLKLRAEDKRDREAERQRIKEQHKARKRKEREARRAVSEGAMVVLGPEGSDEDGMEQMEGSGDEYSGGDSSAGESEGDSSPRPQRKRTASESDEHPRKKGRSLEEDEELALRLLGGN